MSDKPEETEDEIERLLTLKPMVDALKVRKFECIMTRTGIECSRETRHRTYEVTITLGFDGAKHLRLYHKTRSIMSRDVDISGKDNERILDAIDVMIECN